MKNRKSLFGIGLSICLAFQIPMSGIVSHAQEITVPPHPSELGGSGRGMLPGQPMPGGLPAAGSSTITAGNQQEVRGPGETYQGAPGMGTSASPLSQGPGSDGQRESGQQAGAPGGQGEAGTAAGQPESGAESGQAAGEVQSPQPGTGGSQEQLPGGQQDTPQTSQAALQEPEIAAEGAVLMDGATGKVLYGKNGDQQFYPASITKVMTALLVLERCSLKDTVTFSSSATTNLESGAVSLDITEGDQLTVEQCLHGLLMKSANEIGNGLAEHVAGSVPNFAELMNARARELGCTNTNFVNPHGLNDENHKTTPHDMALIMRAALQKEDFRRIDTTRTYDFPATKKAAARTITMGHKMMYPSDSRFYEGIVGGKTGYTSKAGNTLVTGAERNGVQLIVVIMKSKQTHYTDTKALLDYGFANYQALMAQ